jgi:hypothetical protein
MEGNWDLKFHLISMRFFLLITLLVLAAFVAIWCRDRAALENTRRSLTNLATEGAQARNSRSGTNTLPLRVSRPSAGLLQLRAEVTALRNELESPIPAQISKEQAANDWALVHSAAKPSEHPGFVSFANAKNVGFATPETAFQSFNYAMRHQEKEPVDDTARTMELWDVPDNWAEPGAYSGIDIGEGMGGEIGYRVVAEEKLAANQVKLIVDFEKPDGSSFRRSKVLVEHNGRWRMKPVSVTPKNPSR